MGVFTRAGTLLHELGPQRLFDPCAQDVLVGQARESHSGRRETEEQAHTIDIGGSSVMLYPSVGDELEHPPLQRAQIPVTIGVLGHE